MKDFKLLKTKARELRNQGLTIKEIMEKLPISSTTITKYTGDIKLSSDQLNRIATLNNKYIYNVDIFKNPNELTYYLLGVFMSDGSIHHNLKNCDITSKDIDWLKSIGSLICPTKPLTKVKNSNCNRLVICNKFITNWLVQNNCIPNKSLTLEISTIPDNYLSHFIRGVFDGDGNINISKCKGNTYSLGTYIVSASKVFIDQISDKLKFIQHSIVEIENKNISIMGGQRKDYNNVYRIKFNGQNAVKFCDFIYQNNKLCLDRKLQVYNNYKEIRSWELKNLVIPGKFDNPKEIIELLKTKTYNEVGKLYNITGQSVRNRLKSIGLYPIKQAI